MVTQRTYATASLPGIAAGAVLLAGIASKAGTAPTPAVIALLAIAVPFVGATLLPVIALAGDSVRTWAATLVGIVTGVATLALVPRALSTPETVQYTVSWAPIVEVEFGLYLDALGVMMAAIAGVVGALVLVFSTRFMEREDGLTRYYALTLLFVGGMIGFGLTDSLVALYAFWEVLGLCSMGLIAFWLRDDQSTRAGMKAFITTRFGDIGLLAGIAILFGVTGTFSIQGILDAVSAGSVPGWALAWAGGLFILAAVGKSAQLPLHVWLPDAMEAPTTSTALIHAACMVNAGIYLIARTVPIFEGIAWWSSAVLVIGTATAFLAAVLATYERDFKRALAYCTISQLGYVMAALGLAHGLLPATFHLLSHSLFKALLFLGAGAIIYEIGGSVHKHVDMFEYRGIASREQMPITNLTFLVGILGLIGFPGFNGFWSKELIFHAGMTGSPLEQAAFVVLALTAVLTAVYSIRIYYLLFLGDPSADASRVPVRMAVPLVALAVLTATSWLAIGPYSHALETYFGTVAVEAYTLAGLVGHVLTPTTLGLTAGILGGGLVGFRYRETVYAAAPESLLAVLDRRYGFDDAYLAIVDGYRGLAGIVRRTQTGDVNYNVVGIALGLALGVVALLAL